MAAGLKLTYYYGYTTFIAPVGAFSGGFFLIMFAFLFNIFLFHYLQAAISLLKKGVLFVLIILPVLGIWTSGSRSALVGLVAVLFFSLFLYALHKKMFKRFVIGTSIVLFLIAVILPWHISYYGPVYISTAPSHRILDIVSLAQEFNPDAPNSRAVILKLQITEVMNQPLSFILGHGKATKIGGLGSHNYYVEVLGDTGFIGFSLFFVLIFAVIKIAWQGFLKEKDSLAKGLCAGLLLVTFVMLMLSFTDTIFRIAKMAEIYWVFVALCVAALRVVQYRREEET